MLRGKYETQMEKLSDLCDNISLTFNFDTSTFPVKLEISPKEQDQFEITMTNEDPEEGQDKNKPDVITITFGTEMWISNSGEFLIEDAEFSKIRNAAKKLHYLYLQLYYFEMMTERKATA